MVRYYQFRVFGCLVAGGEAARPHLPVWTVLNLVTGLLETWLAALWRALGAAVITISHSHRWLLVRWPA